MRFPRSVLVLALSAAALAGPAAYAAVVCQKGNVVKIRPEACKPKETRVATLGSGDVAGIWERTGGTFQNWNELDARFLVLNPDGSGELTASGGDGPILTCVPFNYARNPGGTIVVDDLGWLLDQRIYRVALDGDVLELTDAVGATAQFERASAVDPDARCEALVQTQLFTGLPTPDDSTGLVFDGTDLWYTQHDVDVAVSFDPATGTPGTTLPLSAYLHAAQGADFWTHCGCGGSDEAFRITRPGATVDTVNTETELGEEISLEALAFQATTGALWLYGWNNANEGRLMKVDASGEPDVLLQAFDLDAGLGGMTFAGNELWALNEGNQSVLRIDVATGQVTGTFLLPDRTAYWRAIAAIGDQLYVVGEGAEQGGATLRAGARSARGSLGGSTGRGRVLVVQKPS